MHVTTTPSVSYITRLDDFDCGAMISASHNSFGDNGIKLVNRWGEKMDDATIELIEAYLDGDLKRLGISDGDLPLAKGGDIGCIIDHAAGRNRYVGYLISLATRSFKNLRIGLDCANGSSWMIAKSVFDALGAKTYVINNSPDGTNINEGAGSTHIEGLQRFVRANLLDIGFAFDGDADRCLAVDEKGEVITGDHILYIFANALKGRGQLTNNTVVATVMSNIGLFRALDEAGIAYEKTAVGDKYVYECMTKNGHCVGGEQSGHIILSKYATTGDGIMTAIKLTECMLEAKKKMSELAAPVVIYPQVLKNVRVLDKDAVMNDADILARADEINRELGANGRLLLRSSGTEPLIRVMVEAAFKSTCEQYVHELVRLIHKKGYADT
jgi:phosphoglucosamine mutase